MFKKAALTISILAATTACTVDSNQYIQTDVISGNQRAENAVLMGRDVDPAYPRPNHTYATYNLGYGIQVEYFAKDGSNYLWFRGNSRSLPGQWKIDDSGFRTDICFKYGADTKDALTGRPGGAWECGRLDHSLNSLVSVVEGDPFNLSKGSVPDMKLDKCELPAPMKQMVWSMPCF